MSEFTKADFNALLRAFVNSKPMTPEETDAAKAALAKMSHWRSMSFDELSEVIKAEDAARSAAEK